jgi:two-component system C4-dicarboxylate transport sensor histidine kinase DctB
MGETLGRQAPDAELATELGGRRFTAEDLAHLNRMSVVGLVLPNVAHEVNNALQVVSGLVEMVAARPDLPPDVVDKLGRIGAQAGRASSLIRELVAFSRRDHATVGVTDVRKVVEAAVALRRYHLSRDRVGVTLDVPADTPCLARLDAHYLQQVLVNLVVNAEQALRGRDQPAIRLFVTASPSAVEILIEDNGTGMDDEVRGRAASLFFSTRPSPALGLGLAVSRALVASQGGRLSVEPGPAGTRVRVWLPRFVPPAV